MFASRFLSSQLSKNASFPTVEKRLVLHYTSARSVLTGRRLKHSACLGRACPPSRSQQVATLLWEPLSRANRKAIQPPAVRSRQFVVQSMAADPTVRRRASPVRGSQRCLPPIRIPQPSPRLHDIIRTRRCHLPDALEVPGQHRTLPGRDIRCLPRGRTGLRRDVFKSLSAASTQPVRRRSPSDSSSSRGIPARRGSA